jgi:hypothetical protein
MTFAFKNNNECDLHFTHVIEYYVNGFPFEWKTYFNGYINLFEIRWGS